MTVFQGDREIYSHNFIPTHKIHAMILLLPLPDGSRTLWFRRGGMPFGICRNVRQGLEGGGDQCGSVGGLRVRNNV